MANIHTVGILGSGIMGAGLAEVAAQAGYQVIVRSRSADAANGMVARIDRGFVKAIERGRSTEDDRSAVMGRIRATDRIEDLRDCDLVIESVVEELGVKRDLFAELGEGNNKTAKLTDNGMHLNDRGYAAAALVFRERFLGNRATASLLKLDTSAGSVSGEGLKVLESKWAADKKSVSVTYQQETLSPLPVRVTLSSGSLKTTAKEGEAPTVSTREVAGKIVYELHSTDQYNELRSLITRKNEQYFHRWRPQNITYLFGFRKHEQGNNAADIARFDPFIRDLESRIHETQTPKATTVTLQVAP